MAPRRSLWQTTDHVSINYPITEPAAILKQSKSAVFLETRDLLFARVFSESRENPWDEVVPTRYFPKRSVECRPAGPWYFSVSTTGPYRHSLLARVLPHNAWVIPQHSHGVFSRWTQRKKGTVCKQSTARSPLKIGSVYGSPNTPKLAQGLPKKIKYNKDLA